MKRCGKCNLLKEQTEFGKNKSTKDGLSSYCRGCKKLSDKNSYQKNKEKRLEVSKKYRKHNKDKIRATQKIWRDNNKDKVRQSFLRAFNKNPEKHKARSKLNFLIYKGKIEKPDKCSICDSVVNIEAHHVDYTKPLDVEWVCSKCHYIIHHEIEIRNELDNRR